MGTNYYVKKKRDEREEEESYSSEERFLHIGKSSMGWEFSFAKQFANDLTNGIILDSKEIWMFFLQNLNDDLHIINEYSEEVDFEYILEMVNNKSPGSLDYHGDKRLKNHYDYCMENDGYCTHAFKDADGFTIMLTEYS